MPPLESLPGGDLIGAGLHDLDRGVLSAAALLVSIGAPRLRRLGLVIPRVESDPEHRLAAPDDFIPVTDGCIGVLRFRSDGAGARQD